MCVSIHVRLRHFPSGVRCVPGRFQLAAHRKIGRGVVEDSGLRHSGKRFGARHGTVLPDTRQTFQRGPGTLKPLYQAAFGRLILFLPHQPPCLRRHPCLRPQRLAPVLFPCPCPWRVVLQATSFLFHARAQASACGAPADRLPAPARFSGCAYAGGMRCAPRRSSTAIRRRGPASCPGRAFGFVPCPEPCLALLRCCLQRQVLPWQWPAQRDVGIEMLLYAF